MRLSHDEAATKDARGSVPPLLPLPHHPQGHAADEFDPRRANQRRGVSDRITFVGKKIDSDPYGRL